MQTQKSKIVNLAVVLFVMLLPWPHLAEGQQPGKNPADRISDRRGGDP